MTSESSSLPGDGVALGAVRHQARPEKQSNAKVLLLCPARAGSIYLREGHFLAESLSIPCRLGRKLAHPS
jgi:hypothetical protein